MQRIQILHHINKISENLALYLFHQLSNNSIPLLGLWVVNAIHMIRHQSYGVLEPDLTSDPLEQIDAESLEPRVPCQILVLLYHHVWFFLREIRFLWWITRGRVSRTRMNTDDEMETGRRTDISLLSMEKIQRQELVSMVCSVLGIIGRTNANDSDGNF